MDLSFLVSVDFAERLLAQQERQQIDPGREG
jgi:hypothetical protein